MAKKPAGKKPSASSQPSSLQMKAIQRLLEAEKYPEAVTRIRSLMTRFPEHGGLRRALIEALEQQQDDHGAGIAAFEWVSIRPNNLLAQETLFAYACQFGHLLLADRTASRVRDLGGKTPGFPLPSAMIEGFLTRPDGTHVSIDDMMRFDIGRLYLEGQQFEAALSWFADLDFPPARNNDAFARYHLGRIDEALEYFLVNWKLDADNLFSLGWAARLRLYRGDDIGAQGLCTPLAAATARRLDDALGQLGALLFLGQDQAAWDAFERARRADWFKPGTDSNDLMLLHFGACAASRLGRMDEARQLWRQASAANSSLSLPKDNLILFEEHDEARDFPMIFEFALALPLSYLNRMRDPSRDIEKELDELTASNLYLDTLYRTGDQKLRQLVGIILRHRTRQGDADVADRLKTFARLPIGTGQERFALLSFLVEQEHLTGNKPVEMWDQGEVREVNLISTEIYREPAEQGFPDDLQELLGESIACFNRNDLDAAEKGMQTILERLPDHPVALGNLAAVRLRQHRREEGIALLRQAIARNPEYLFARCNLASLLIKEDKFEEAEALLSHLAERPRLHIQEVFALYGTFAQLRHAQGDTQMAQQFIAYLENLVEDEDDERRLLQIKQSISPNSFTENFMKLIARAAQSKPSPRRRK